MHHSDQPIDVHLATVWQAAAQQQRISTEYFSPTSGQWSSRTIEPVGTVYYGAAWHVIAYCCLRQDFRDFRLDRMSKLVRQDEQFEAHNRNVLLTYLKRQAQVTDTELIRVRFDHGAIDEVRAARIQQGFMAELVGKEAVEMWFLTGNVAALRRWLAEHEGIIEVNL